MEELLTIYGFIKDSKVINTIVIEGEKPDFIELLKNQFDLDDIISGEGCDFQPGIGMTYDYTTKQFIPEPTPPSEESGTILPVE
jgi:hypothetical protein